MLVFRLVTIAVLMTTVSACAGDSAPQGDAGECDERQDLTVLAASSLVAALPALEQSFLEANRCVTDVQFSFGSSAVLATQIVNGAPVDVFVAASTSTMERVVAENLTDQRPLVFAQNSAAMLVADSSSFAGSISRLADLLDERFPGVKVGLCAPSVPCGALADEVLANATRAYGEPRLVRSDVADTEASSAEDLVTKVRLGELDAGITYASDCATGRGVRCVEIPAEVSGAPVNSSTSLSALVVSGTRAASDFVDFLTSSTVRSRLVDDFGFGAP